MVIIIKKLKISFNNSGTTLRLLTPLIAGSKVNAKIIGDKSLSQKTIPIRIFKTVFNELKTYKWSIFANKN